MEWTKLQMLLNNSLCATEFVNLSPSDAFTKFYALIDKSEYAKWLEDTIQEMPKKLNSRAETLRNHGNKLYAKGQTNSAIDFYTRSLKFSIYNDIDYGKALANRSAALFSLKQYKECLKDIDNCFNSKYPEELRLKVKLRKLQCYCSLNMSDKYFYEYNQLYPTLKDNQVFQSINENLQGNSKMPVFDTEKGNNIGLSAKMLNEKFAYASKSLKLSFNHDKGRHVIASDTILTGEVIFVEKAFIAAPIFKSYEELIPETCYHCLAHIPYSNIPCSSCTYCLFCSDECKNLSWSLGHQFECPGMIIWYELGQGLPALKFLMKGTMNGFPAVSNSITEFGGYIDNYPFANSLIDNFTERIDKMHILGIAVIIVIYLKEKTTFYDYLKERIPEKELIAIDNLIGGLLVKHMSQLFSNGSIIERLPNNQPIAAAIYPSISMMNHACQSNVSISYEGNIAIVKATEEIAEGNEVFNNYGVDSRTDKNLRQEYLRENYCFDCKCNICNGIIK